MLLQIARAFGPRGQMDLLCDQRQLREVGLGQVSEAVLRMALTLIITDSHFSCESKNRINYSYQIML